MNIKNLVTFVYNDVSLVYCNLVYVSLYLWEYSSTVEQQTFDLTVMGSNPITLKMRYANHIVLDFENSKQIQNSQYWVLKFINQHPSQPSFLNHLQVTNTLTPNQSKFNQQDTNQPNLDLIISASNSDYQSKSTLNTALNLININFLRKEKLYTKLKYSRSPAYDIVSGGAAALFAGFLGFLVSEKFGFELVDSGDFYFLTMYVVFLCFSLRPLLTITEPTKSLWTIFSLYGVMHFYTNVVTLFFRSLK